MKKMLSPFLLHLLNPFNFFLQAGRKKAEEIPQADSETLLKDT